MKIPEHFIMLCRGKIVSIGSVIHFSENPINQENATAQNDLKNYF